MNEYTTDQGALLFELTTDVGIAKIRLHDGKQAKAESFPEGFKYRGRHYIGTVHLGSTDRLSTPREDYAPDWRFSSYLKKENGGPVSSSTFGKIGDIIAARLREHIAADPAILDLLARAETLNAAGNLYEEIAKAEKKLEEMHAEYQRLMEAAYK